jgi:hypothetical protein
MADPRTIPKFSTRLWSEEVGLAEAGELAHQDIGYRFSSGRTFAASKYDPPVPPEQPVEGQE